MQEAARQAVRDYVARAKHRDRVERVAGRVLDHHGDAIDRLSR